MAMKPGLTLRPSQQLALTPQLQQAIRLLQLSSLELAGEVEQMLIDNPFLERVDEHEHPGPEDDAPSADTHAQGAEDDGLGTVEPADAETDETPWLESWDGEGDIVISADDGLWGGDLPVGGAALSGASDWDPGDAGGPDDSLTDHLHRQARVMRLSAEDAAVLGFLIESLNDDGYLEDSLAQLAATLLDDDDEADVLQELVHRFTLALKLLQSMDPVGVGARDLGECLSLQLQTLQRGPGRTHEQRETVAAALRICGHPHGLELLAQRDVPGMAALVGRDKKTVQAAVQLVAGLDPRPGRRFARLEQQFVVPDVIVRLDATDEGRRWRVQLNPAVMPRLRVHEAYAGALRDSKGAEGHAALSSHLQDARWFVRNIEQRFDTILRVATAIVDRQRGFFSHGEMAMQPLIQRELADELALHESTISRVTTAKYMATPRGTFELKYFFSSSLATESGGSTSSIAVRARIQQLVDAEDAARPLSDNRLSELLKAQGIECARRTVAKYRETLKIPTARDRRQS